MRRSPDTLAIREELAACETTEQTAERERELREVIERIEWFAPMSRKTGIVDYPTGRFGRRASFSRIGTNSTGGDVLIWINDRRAPIRQLQLRGLAEGETPEAYRGRNWAYSEDLRSRQMSVEELREAAGWLETNARTTQATARPR